MCSSSEVEEVHHLVAQLADVDPAVVRAPASDQRELLGQTARRPRRAAGSGSPSTTCRAASSSSMNPAPPASTTPASFSTGEQLGRVVERRLAGRAGGAQHADEAGALGRRGRRGASADSRTTVRIVPSTGFSTAW